MQVVIVGAGNVAHVLGGRLLTAGHKVQQIYGRNKMQVSLLAEKLLAQPIDDFADLSVKADVYIIAVSDNAIASVVAAMPFVDGLIVHTAGSVPMHVLQATSKKTGVLYPLQSLRKEKADYREIPLLINGNTENSLQEVQAVAKSISGVVMQASDAYRLHLHLAAVAVSNFTNHLYALAEGFCKKEKADFMLLQPLIEETAGRMRQYSPAQMQTGPAIRGDEATIYQHLQLLERHPHLQRVYRQLSESIQTVNSEQ